MKPSPSLGTALALLLLVACEPAPKGLPSPAPLPPSQQILGYSDQVPPGFRPELTPGFATLLDLLGPLPPEGLLVLGDTGGFFCTTLARLNPQVPVDCVTFLPTHTRILEYQKASQGLARLSLRELGQAPAEALAASPGRPLVLALGFGPWTPGQPDFARDLARTLAPGGRLLLLFSKPLFDFHPDMTWSPSRTLQRLAALPPDHPLMPLLGQPVRAALQACRERQECTADRAFGVSLATDLNRALGSAELFAALDEYYNKSTGYSSELQVFMSAADGAALQWLVSEYGEAFYPPYAAPDPDSELAIRQVNHLLLRTLLGLSMETWRWPLQQDLPYQRDFVAKALAAEGLTQTQVGDPFADLQTLLVVKN